MELRIINPTEDGFIKSIEFNHEEIKHELITRLEKYQGLVYSDEEIKLAKTDRADLNKFKTAIEDKRKEIKKQCLLPYENFEAKIKEITTLIDKPVFEIDSQVKAYEEKVKADKKRLIEEMYIQFIGDLSPILPLSKLWDSKWLNSTCSLPSIQKAIEEAISKVTLELQTIESLGSKFETEIKSSYVNSLSLTDALATKSRLEENERKLEEMRIKREEAAKKAEEERKAREEEKLQMLAKLEEERISRELEEANKVPEFIPIVEEIIEPVQPEPFLEENPFLEPEPIMEVLDFRVWVTSEQKELLKDFLMSNSIRYGKVQ